MNGRITTTRKLTAQSVTVGQLRALTEGVGDEAKVTISVSKGDRPFDSGTVYITVDTDQEASV